MLRFVFKEEILDYPKRLDESTALSTTYVLSSQLYRILGGGTWNPHMLQNYANEVGIVLEGIPRFEKYYANRKK